MSSRSVIPISAHPQVGKIGEADYFRLYRQSIDDPDGFWGEHGKRLDWIKPYTKVKNASFDGRRADRMVRGRHPQRLLELRRPAPCPARRADRDPVGGRRSRRGPPITYRQLHEAVCRFANVLKARGVEKGDRVTIYMPMIPEIAVAVLACARIGAVHSVVFGGFSPDSLAGRIRDCRSTCLVTADEGLRGGRTVPLKRNADAALENCPDVKDVIVVRRTGGDDRLGRRPRHLVSRGLRRGFARLPARGDVGRGPAVHPLHLGLDRSAQGRAAHDRRLSRLRRR